MAKRTVTAAPLLLTLVAALPNVHHHDILARRGTAASQQVHIPALEAAGMTAYLEKAIPFADPSGDEIAPHTIPLAPVIGTSATQRYINMMISDDPLDGPGAGPPSEGVANGQAPIKNVNDIVYMTNANVGGQDFQLVLDTGSADTWLVSSPFQCLNNRMQETDIRVCKFAKEYKRSASFKQDPSLKLATAYADGERLQGIIGKETMAMGGVTVSNQTIGLVQRANWHGDGFSSGLIGMAYPSVTRAMASDGGVAKAQHYDPVFFNMYKQKLIKPVFAVALNRKNEGSGALSLGGLPGGNIKYSPEFARAPIERLALEGLPGTPATPEHAVYVAKASGFHVAGKPIQLPTNLVVDSGTTLSMLPNDVVEAIVAAWQPAPRTNAGGQYLVSCNSTPPKIGVIIGGKELWIDGKDLLIQQSGSVCLMGVTRASGVNLLGGPFMKSVLSVFDVGAGEMRFHQRIR